MLPILAGVGAKWGIKLGTKLIILCVILLVMASLYIWKDYYQKKYLKVNAQLIELQLKYNEQVEAATKCAEDLKKLERENKAFAKKVADLQKVHNATVARYEKLLQEMSEQAYTEVIIQVVDRPECPKIEVLNEGLYLPELRYGRPE